jgi:hypothetical protein
VNRRALLGGFAATAAGVLMPDTTRRVYSFLWNRETEYERTMREAVAALRDHFDRFRQQQAIVIPHGLEINLAEGGHCSFRVTKVDWSTKTLHGVATVTPLPGDILIRLNSPGDQVESAEILRCG